MTGFAELIAPLEPAVFFQYHWETKPLFLLRSQPGRFSDIFALPVVDHSVESRSAERTAGSTSEPAN
jgi:hypothetical protein